MFVASSLTSCLTTAALSLLTSCGFQACRCASAEVVKTSARLAYSVLFFFSMITAWILRDYAKPMLEKIPWIMRGAIDPGARWFGQQAVFRVSMGSFIFFGGLSAALAGVKYTTDKRDVFLQHGSWGIKGLLWLACNGLPFLFPNALVIGYSYLARAGSAVFIFIQILLLIDFTHSWNDTWVSQEDDRLLYALLTLTLGSYAGCLVLGGTLLHFFNPVPGCSFNVTLIAVSLLLCFVVSALSLHPAVKSGSLFPASLISLYIMYLCYSALASEPKEYQCNALGQRVSAANESTLAMGVVVTVASIVYSAWRAGSNGHQLFSLEAPEDDAPAAATTTAPAPQPPPAAPRRRAIGEDLSDADVAGAKPLLSDVHGGMADTDPEAATPAAAPRDADEGPPVSYNYSFFHMIFALASMYLAMLMTGWSPGSGGSSPDDKDLIGVGWANVWAKLVTQWATGLLYVWTLVAPLIWPDREFS